MKKTVLGVILLVINFVLIVSGITCFIVFSKSHGILIETLYYFGWVAIGAATGTILTTIGSFLLLLGIGTK